MYHVGLYTLQVSNPRDPSPQNQIQDVKEWYVQYLTLLIDKDTDHEGLTAPFLVIASVESSAFQSTQIG